MFGNYDPHRHGQRAREKERLRQQAQRSPALREHLRRSARIAWLFILLTGSALLAFWIYISFFGR